MVLSKPQRDLIRYNWNKTDLTDSEKKERIIEGLNQQLSHMTDTYLSQINLTREHRVTDVFEESGGRIGCRFNTSEYDDDSEIRYCDL